MDLSTYKGGLQEKGKFSENGCLELNRRIILRCCRLSRSVNECYSSATARVVWLQDPPLTHVSSGLVKLSRSNGIASSRVQGYYTDRGVVYVRQPVEFKYLHVG